MYKINDVKNPRLNVLIYGPSGVGKTWLASTCQDHPDMADVYFLNVEGGLATIWGKGKNILVMDIVGIEAFTPTIDMPKLLPHQSTLEDEWRKLIQRQGDYANINTVVIDSGSECQTLSLEIISAQAAKRNSKRSVDDVYLEDYGRSTSQLKRFFRRYRDLSMNVIITALPQEQYGKQPDGTPNSDLQGVRPQFTNKLATSVMGYMDMVWYMYNDSKNRVLLTQPKGVYQAKTRGINFAKALGPNVILQNLNDPSHTGYTLSTIYDMFIKTENLERDIKLEEVKL